MSKVKRALEKVENALIELGQEVSYEDVDRLKSEGLVFQGLVAESSSPIRFWWILKILPEPWQDIKELPMKKTIIKEKIKLLNMEIELLNQELDFIESEEISIVQCCKLGKRKGIKPWKG